MEKYQEGEILKKGILKGVHNFQREESDDSLTDSELPQKAPVEECKGRLSSSEQEENLTVNNDDEQVTGGDDTISGEVGARGPSYLAYLEETKTDGNDTKEADIGF